MIGAGLLLPALFSAAAQACPFCFSRTDGNSAFVHGLTLAIIGLAVTVFAILITLVVAVVRMERRKIEAEGRAA